MVSLRCCRLDGKTAECMMFGRIVQEVALARRTTWFCGQYEAFVDDTLLENLTSFRRVILGPALAAISRAIVLLRPNGSEKIGWVGPSLLAAAQSTI